MIVSGVIRQFNCVEFHPDIMKENLFVATVMMNEYLNVIAVVGHFQTKKVLIMTE